MNYEVLTIETASKIGTYEKLKKQIEIKEKIKSDIEKYINKYIKDRYSNKAWVYAYNDLLKKIKEIEEIYYKND